MIELTYVICNAGDGSNFVLWVTDQEVLDKMQEKADDGDDRYASGDGLQDTTLYFPDDFDLKGWLKLNHISLTTLKDFD